MVLAGREHEPPASVTVTTLFAPRDAVAVHDVNPVRLETVGVAGIVKLSSKSIVMVLFGLVPVRAPTALDLKPTVQFAVSPVPWGEPLKLTLLTLEAVITTLAAGLTCVLSAFVFTVKLVFAYVPCAGFWIPSIRIFPVVLAGSEHVPPLSLSVIVTVAFDTLADPEAAQFVKLLPLGNVMVGVAGITKLFSKSAVIVLAEPPPELTPFKAPLALVVNWTVQFAVAPPAWVEPVKLTFVTAVAAAT